LISFAVRLTVAGGRSTALRLFITVLGAAVGVAVLLLAAGLEPAIVARGHRIAQRVPAPHLYEVATIADGQPVPADGALLLVTSTYRVAGRDVTVVDVASTGPDAPTPPGLAAPPTSAQVYASPALHRAVDLLSALADGRRVAGTIEDAGLADPGELLLWRGWDPGQLRAATGELAVVRDFPVPPPRADWWSSEPARLIGVAGATTVLIVPVAVFIGVMVRLGSMQRQRRMASLALVGATARQLHLLAGVEGGLLGLVALAVGWVIAHLIRPAVAAITIGGHAWFPSDITPRPALAVGLSLAIVVAAAGAGLLAVRPVSQGPLALAARAHGEAVSAWRLAGPLLGLFVVTVVAWHADALSPWTVAALTSGGTALVLIGIPVAGPWLVRRVSRRLAGTARGASLLVAARRLEDDPSAALRASSGVILAVFALTLIQGYTTGNLGTRAEVGFPRGTDAIIEPYGAHPRQVERFLDAVRRSHGVDSLAVVQRLTTGDGHPVLFADCAALNRTAIVVLEPCSAPGWRNPDLPAADLPVVDEALLTRPVGVADLGVLERPSVATDVHLGGDLVIDSSRLRGDVSAVADTTLVAISTGGPIDDLVIPASTLLPGYELITPRTRTDAWNRALVEVERGIALLGGVVMLVGFASLVASLLGGLLVQRDTIRHLRRAGVTAPDLLATTLWQAAVPLAITVPLAVATALLMSAAFTHAVGGSFDPPLAWIAAVAAFSVVASLVPVAASFPLLERATRPETPNAE
jgi:hypothetical protein